MPRKPPNQPGIKWTVALARERMGLAGDQTKWNRIRVRIKEPLQEPDC